MPGRVVVVVCRHLSPSSSLPSWPPASWRPPGVGEPWGSHHPVDTHHVLDQDVRRGRVSTHRNCKKVVNG